MGNVFSWILARISEQSTYSGLATVIASIGFLPHASDIGALVPTVGVLVMGIIKILRPDPVTTAK